MSIKLSSQLSFLTCDVCSNNYAAYVRVIRLRDAYEFSYNICHTCANRPPVNDIPLLDDRGIAYDQTYPIAVHTEIDNPAPYRLNRELMWRFP